MGAAPKSNLRVGPQKRHSGWALHVGPEALQVGPQVGTYYSKGPKAPYRRLGPPGGSTRGAYGPSGRTYQEVAHLEGPTGPPERSSNTKGPSAP